jgi:AcrR family transcriptional regulator
MSKFSETEATITATEPMRRVGRPPLQRAGEVEERILEAARKVFIERGFEGASMDQIAEKARAGKPTIYARYLNKEGLFVATVENRIAAKNARLLSHRPNGATVEERLSGIGAAMLRETLTPEFVGLYRVVLAEARRLPELVTRLGQLARKRGIETVAALLAEVTECSSAGAILADPESCEVAARAFADLILLPLLLRALSGENLETLDKEIDSHVGKRVAFFLAACRHGGVV